MQIINLLHRGPLPYMSVDALQRYLHEKVASLHAPDTLIIWEAQDTYTAGRRTQVQDIPDTNVPVIAMDRGGSVTYHGPGQLVIYPIVKVRPPQDVVAFVRTTEQALIEAVQTWDINAKTVAGRSGVWIDAQYMPTGLESKLCAIGIKFAQETTMHGMALNVSTDLEQFMRVRPCGITDAGVTSLAQLGLQKSLAHTAELLIPYLSHSYQQFLARPEPEIHYHQAPDQLLEEAEHFLPPVPERTGVAWKPTVEHKEA
ncbi:lipoyl(octanoyl) transferase LipB [Arcanobacterium pinnipediorum]|uniref:Octanoyltransferase n=1 Tax=Arcanobacterium pinnipediorum TaxID=1503041 RepID=A0ABY5AG22_9ACTO|nr:lipoyl(octanoyl) transferase LipB [Arcanobacterium pinnipediorum]USR79145.1 lipoyl(octanoyl) transferase LipB [Arcanobacterium pinnipediorum]